MDTREPAGAGTGVTYMLGLLGTVLFITPACGAGGGTVGPDGIRSDAENDAGDAGPGDGIAAVDGAGADVAGPPDAPAGPLTVVSVEPAARSLTAAVDGTIVVHFDRPVKRDSVTAKTLWAFGRWSGPVRDGQLTFSDGDKAVGLKPRRPFTAGDRVTVILSHDLMGADGSNLRAAGYSFQFWTAARPAGLRFTEIARMTTRTDASVKTRSYGASVADLDGNGYLDLLVINEDSADLRIFLSKGDGTGTFRPFVQPTTPLDQRASPSETTDFNGDGIVDLVTANLNANNLSILLGKGDGTFAVSQKPRVSGEPRGLAVIDVDGDGDVDVVNTNADGDNLSLLANDGAGKFPISEAAGIVFFDAGHGKATVSQEFGLFSGDMDEDGILDLVIGARGRNGGGAGIVVNRGTGAGSFSFASLQGPRTTPWQLAVGDLDGDGHEDVATADADLSASASRNTATLLAGDGKGALTIRQAWSEELSRPFAVDLGDLDGDGDLDVVVSNYAADWLVLQNDGAGRVARSQTVMATTSASCALLIDVDNDRDLDLVLIDENADELIILRQS